MHSLILSKNQFPSKKLKLAGTVLLSICLASGGVVQAGGPQSEKIRFYDFMPEAAGLSGSPYMIAVEDMRSFKASTFEDEAGIEGAIDKAVLPKEDPRVATYVNNIATRVRERQKLMKNFLHRDAATILIKVGKLMFLRSHLKPYDPQPDNFDALIHQVPEATRNRITALKTNAADLAAADTDYTNQRARLQQIYDGLKTRNLPAAPAALDPTAAANLHAVVAPEGSIPAKSLETIFDQETTDILALEKGRTQAKKALKDQQTKRIDALDDRIKVYQALVDQLESVIPADPGAAPEAGAAAAAVDAYNRRVREYGTPPVNVRK